MFIESAQNNLKGLQIFALLSMLSASGCMSTSSGQAIATTADESATTTTPTASILLTPNSQIIDPGATVQFTASGGTAPYTYSVTNGGGTIDSSTGLFVAPTNSSAIDIAVNDVNGNFAYANITVAMSNLTLSAVSTTVSIGATDQLTASGGTAPYTYTVTAGGGTVDPNAGVFTAPSAPGLTQVSVEDATGAVAYLTITTES